MEYSVHMYTEEIHFASLQMDLDLILCASCAEQKHDETDKVWGNMDVARGGDQDLEKQIQGSHELRG